MSLWSRKSVSRREQIRKDRPDTTARKWEHLRSNGVIVSLQIAAVFWVAATGILMLRQDVVPYRPGQWAHHDIISRVDFTFMDKQQLAEAQRLARQNSPRVYTAVPDVWKPLEEKLLALPDLVAGVPTLNELSPELREVLDAGAFTPLKEIHANERRRTAYNNSIKAFIASLKQFDPANPAKSLIILKFNARSAERDSGKEIIVRGIDASGNLAVAQVKSEVTFAPEITEDLLPRLSRLADEKIGDIALSPKIAALTLKSIKPNFVIDEGATAEEQNRAANVVTATQGQINYRRNQPLVLKGEIEDRHWQLLRAEHEAFVQTLDRNRIKQTIGLAAIVLLITTVLATYVMKYQPKVVKKHPRAIAICALLLSMLLMAQLAGIGTNPLFVFGVAPTILVAMILTIAYDQRFAMGIATLHAVLVSIALSQGLSFFVILFAGVMTCCYLLDDIRTRSKLIEVGGATALAMMAATFASGLISMDPVKWFIIKNCLYTGAAGIATGFVVLGILPFIEKAFRITTSMTLLELADASHPLLRRLSVEAPGTYNHSLQVATIAEACAEAIHVNSLLSRVASYYHDVGKINKPDYFCENQSDGINRHMNLSPSVSLLIIIGHVKDGVELAKEYNLPTSILPFIQQHHGTTLVEFFYHQAMTKKDQSAPDQPAISEVQYRYPGPRPRTKEIAIVMVADAVESATRAMQEPSAGRIEALVHELVMKRLLDGQFDDCDLSMREIQQIERSCVKSLLSIYHGRIAYPSSATIQGAPTSAPGAAPVIRTA
ncbi:MAG: cyclic-di-AMP phosphodiesterase PgpH [Humisphaera sp.]|nr:cyclic-di-AMP phosphodiesterase PgpH [Humisphaera sp.]